MALVEPALPADGRILFFRRDRETFGFLSNFFPAPIVIDDDPWPTVEHFYQAQKSLDPDYRLAIRSVATPGHAKRLGTAPDVRGWRSRQSWFRRNGQMQRADWLDIRLDVMRRAVTAKFEQNAPLARQLLATKGAELIEDSRFDAYWGVGPRGDGTNWLGRVLMEVRTRCATMKFLDCEVNTAT